MATNRDREDQVAGKIAGRVAEYLANIHLATKERATGLVVKQVMAAQHEFFRLVGSEIRATVSPVWDALAAQPESPDWLKRTGDFVGAGRGQWAAMLGGTATGAAMGGGLITLLSNEMAPGIGAMMAANPMMRLSPETIALAKARGLIVHIDPVKEAANNGINRERFDILTALNTQVMGPEVIVELFRRGLVDRDFAKILFHRAGFDVDHGGRLLQLARTHISMADASSMWNRSIIDDDALVHIGAVNGYTRDDALAYRELGGEPPAPEVLYTAFRRGFIDTDRLRRGIVQGPIRNEWFDVLEKLQFRSMTPEQAAGAVTQGHLDADRGQQIAREYGLNPDDFEVLIETAGAPPGVEFASEAYNRGFITDDEFGSMFLESRIKNRYLPLLRRMRQRLMPQETARSMLAKGAMSAERCAEILAAHGYGPDDVAVFIDAATTERTTATRDLSLSTILELYAEQEIPPETATDLIVGLGYDATEAEWLIGLADVRRVRTFRNAVITRVKNGYVKGFFDDQIAGTTLDGLGVPPTRRDTLLALWGIERDTVTKDLTPAQIVAAAKKELMDTNTAVSRLVGQGYDQGDAVILLQLSSVPVEAP